MSQGALIFMLFREKTVTLWAQFIKLYFISLHVIHKDLSIETVVYRCNFLNDKFEKICLL